MNFIKALSILEAGYRESDPGEENCPIAWYSEEQVGHHDHSQCPTIMAMQWMGRHS